MVAVHRLQVASVRSYGCGSRRRIGARSGESHIFVVVPFPLCLTSSAYKLRRRSARALELADPRRAYAWNASEQGADVAALSRALGCRQIAVLAHRLPPDCRASACKTKTRLPQHRLHSNQLVGIVKTGGAASLGLSARYFRISRILNASFEGKSVRSTQNHFSSICTAT